MENNRSRSKQHQTSPKTFVDFGQNLQYQTNCVALFGLHCHQLYLGGVAGFFVPGGLYNIDTVVLQGGIPMMAFFFVNKIIFPKGEANKTMRAK